MNSRIMAKKTWLTAKLCRGLSWNCVDSRLRTIDAFSSPDSLLRVRNCRHDLGIRAQARTFADSENAKEKERKRRSYIERRR